MERVQDAAPGLQKKMLAVKDKENHVSFAATQLSASHFFFLNVISL